MVLYSCAVALQFVYMFKLSCSSKDSMSCHLSSSIFLKLLFLTSVFQKRTDQSFLIDVSFLAPAETFRGIKNTHLLPRISLGALSAFSLMIDWISRSNSSFLLSTKHLGCGAQSILFAAQIAFFQRQQALFHGG